VFYKGKVVACSEIRTKHIYAMWAPQNFLMWYVKLPLGFKRLIEAISDYDFPIDQILDLWRRLLVGVVHAVREVDTSIAPLTFAIRFSVEHRDETHRNSS
jgi:hypothetical protein